MHIALFALSSPLACFVLHVLIQRLWLAANPPRSRQMAVLWIVLFTSFAYAALALLLGDLAQCLYVFTIALMLCGTYFHFFNMSETARRIHILVSLHSGDAVVGEYGPQAMVEIRIGRLLSMGSIVECQGKIFAKKGVLLFAAKVIHFWRSIYYGHFS